MFGGYTLAIDFDGTLVDGSRDEPTWRPLARAFVVAAVASGVRVIVHSCRATCPGALMEAPGDAEEFYRSGQVPPQVLESWAWGDGLRAFLDREGLAEMVEIWDQPGKPMATRYIDDRADRPDFASLASELGLSLADGSERSSPLGAPRPVVQPRAA